MPDDGVTVELMVTDGVVQVMVCCGVNDNVGRTVSVVITIWALVVQELVVLVIKTEYVPEVLNVGVAVLPPLAGLGLQL
jgi:hypothetical protein